MTPQDLLHKLYARCCRMQEANYTAAARYGRLALITGYPSAVLSGITATAVFASFFSVDSAVVWVQLTGIVTSLLTAFAVSSDRYFGFAQKNIEYRKQGSSYAHYKREVENILAFPPGDLEPVVKSLTQQWTDETKDYVEIPDKIWLRFKDKEYPLINGHSQ